MLIPLVIHHETGTAYGVTIPDVPGAFSAGDTLEEAVANAKEAIVFHVEGLLEDAEFHGIQPTAIDVLKQNPDYADAIWAVAEVDLDKLNTRQLRFNVSWPEYLLARVDDYVSAHHETRSGFLAKAALKAMR
nr:type II toxin-antitoxin system HicB family antitoxin [Stenoxybacter acetivorans]